jgi:hypothetical protein
MSYYIHLLKCVWVWVWVCPLITILIGFGTRKAMFWVWGKNIDGV